MGRYYLKDGDTAFTTGAFLVWQDGHFVLDGIEDDTFYDGEYLDFDDDSKPYVERKD